jgi:hypothetical protein
MILTARNAMMKISLDSTALTGFIITERGYNEG